VSIPLADKVLTEMYNGFSVEYISGERAQAPQVGAIPSFGLNLNQSNVMSSFTAFQSTPAPLLTQKGFLNVFIIKALYDPSSQWQLLSFILKNYDLPQYKGWGDLPRNVLPDHPNQGMVKRVEEVRVMVEMKVKQDMTAARTAMVSSHYNNMKQIIGSRSQSFPRFSFN
jgi:hypothetical protein